MRIGKQEIFNSLNEIMSIIKKIKLALVRVRNRFNYVVKPWIGLVYSPIVIYTMGKVGSTSVQTTLQKTHLRNPIFHVHFLSWDNFDKIEKQYRELGLRVPEHIWSGRGLRRFADKTRGKVRWKIITLVREPVAREISDLFENLKRYPDLNKLSVDSLLEAAIVHLRELLEATDESNDYTCTWFDNELKKVFGFDVYAVKFDYEKGYNIFETEHAGILLIRLENLSKYGPEAMRKFLGIQDPQLVNANEGTEKFDKQVYHQLLERISFPETTLDKVYNSRYSRHFYTDAEILAFKKRWSFNHPKNIGRDGE